MNGITDGERKTDDFTQEAPSADRFQMMHVFSWAMNPPSVHQGGPRGSRVREKQSKNPPHCGRRCRLPFIKPCLFFLPHRRRRLHHSRIIISRRFIFHTPLTCRKMTQKKVRAASDTASVARNVYVCTPAAWKNKGQTVSAAKEVTWACLFPWWLRFYSLPRLFIFRRSTHSYNVTICGLVILVAWEQRGSRRKKWGRDSKLFFFLSYVPSILIQWGYHYHG